ncbi:NACHT domain-containing protein [Actinomadura latina]|uniref:NACHT N-terminal Helical domain-containing protein n=1 Tax=Actinomadura latina TaxID=163603 RepID=A0A846Z789_9ACTN|nr:hypothetical protein [Actinomadura latina]NKZ08201.1 hypothetical protein [Actinomadura latina]
MGRPLSYAEAVRMLGESESRLINLLDWLAGLGLAGGGLDVLGAREEAVRLGHALTRDLGDRLRGLNRLTRTERLRAAHTVIVLAAYFEELADAVPEARLHRLNAGEQLSLSGDHDGGTGRRAVAQALTRVELPTPGPSHTQESIRRELLAYYGRLGGSLLEFVSGVPQWARIGEDVQADTVRELSHLMPGRALDRYEEMLRRLAVDCPEFGIWIEHWERRSARTELMGGMATLERLLASMTGRVGAQPTALSRAYQASLHRPITAGGDVPSGLTIPTLEQGYIDHRLRATVMEATARPSQDSWWTDLPVYAEPSRFFAACLTSPEAVSAPLLVLGQPGSGKSVLTRVLAARLPADDFLPILVELRQAPVESDLQTRIEDAVRQTTGERTSWPRLVEAAAGALPVVILDGFDELLQATGVTQTDFLMKVTAFQEREADQGRPVAVIVTSRTAVVDRARIPHGSVVARLEPFDDEQIRAWLANWRDLNESALRRRGLRPLPDEVALAHRELAEQPLLLLMLALYDADGNALHHRSASFDRTSLYERLLREFAGRQIRKLAPDLDDTAYERAVEEELLRLSIVGFAMFNRRAQWVSDIDLDADLLALLDPERARPGNTGLQAPLSAAQIVVGRFFFVHETQVTRDGQVLHTYEFLHATFGEFLIARLVANILIGMAVQAATAAYSPLAAQINDDLLHALLSFAGLTARSPVIGFLDDLLAQLEPGTRNELTELLLELHRRSLHDRPGSAYDQYRPRPLSVPARHAAWSMNLVVLAVLVAGEIRGYELFPGSDDTAYAWRAQATLWRSQLHGEEWAGFFQFIALHRDWDGGKRSIRIGRVDENFQPAPSDIYWIYNIPPGHAMRDGIISYTAHEPSSIRLKSNMICGGTDDVLVHALEPLAAAFPTIANLAVPGERATSCTHALLAALVAGFRDEPCSKVFTDLARVVRELSVLPAEEEHDLYLKAALETIISALDRSLAARQDLAPIGGGLHLDDAHDPRVRHLGDRLNELLRS